MAELSLIESLTEALPKGGGRILRGIGDDAAVVSAMKRCVTTVDSIVEGVHFRLDDPDVSFEDIGRRAMAGALSDIAAMAADTGEAYIALGLPARVSEEQALELMLGAQSLAKETRTTICGGDVVASPALFVSVTIVGWAHVNQKLLGRDGALVGDHVAVTGPLGCRPKRPEPRLREARRLAANRAHALIDISDGIATDALHIAQASGVRVEIDLDALPIDERTERTAARMGVPAWEAAATAGEDYELCVCIGPKWIKRAGNSLRAATGCSLTVVGRVVEGPPGLVLLHEGRERSLKGFEHRW
jgi:thiamine-monophosphate kinase